MSNNSFTPASVGSGYNLSVLDDNFSDIETALDNALSRVNSTDNEMSVDLDMNSNDILNVGTIDAQNITIGDASLESGKLGFEYIPLGDGVYAVGLEYTAYNQYLVYSSTGVMYAVKLTVDLTDGYTTTESTPEDDDNLKPINDVNSENVGEYVSDGQEQLTGASIQPSNSSNDLSLNDTLEASANAIRVSGKLYKCYVDGVLTTVSGEITALDVSSGTATIGGVSVDLVQTGSHAALDDLNPGDGSAHNSSDIDFDEYDTTAELISKRTNGQSKTTHFYERKQVIHETDLPYTAWAYGDMFTDTINDDEYLLQAYTAGSGHVATDKRIFFRRLNYSIDGIGGDFGERIEIDSTSTGPLTVHACGKISNGDYIAIAREGEPVTATYVYRSEDQGLTWTNEGQLYADGSIVNPRECGQIFTASNGYVYSFFGSTGGSGYILKSEDDCSTFTNTLLDNTDVGGIPLEGSFIELNDGTIVCVARATISADFTSKIAAIYTYSTDDGDTWSALAETNIEDMNNNNAAMVYHDDDDIIEIFWCSRYTYDDGYSSMYQAWATPESILTGTFYDARRLPIGSGTRDFGYPAAVKMSDDNVIAGFYNGNDYSASIQYFVGRRPINGGIGSMPALEYGLKNPYSGESHVTYPTTDAEEARDSIGFSRVEYVRSKNSLDASIRIRGDKNYWGYSNAVELFNDVPAASQDIDAESLIDTAGLWNDDIGGLILEVTMEKTETLLVTLLIGAYVSTTTFGERIGNKSSTGNIIVNTITVPLNDGTLRLTVDTEGSLSNITNVTINALGWSSKN